MKVFQTTLLFCLITTVKASPSDAGSNDTTGANATEATTMSTTTTTTKIAESIGLSLSSLQSLGVSKREQEKKSTCSSFDMCESMAGICNKGTCEKKHCSSGFVCKCKKGYTGQFCDKKLSEVKKANDIPMVNGKIVSTDTPATKDAPTSTSPISSSTSSAAPGTTKPKSVGKEHVNGNIDPLKVGTDKQATSYNEPLANKVAETNKLNAAEVAETKAGVPGNNSEKVGSESTNTKKGKVTKSGTDSTNTNKGKVKETGRGANVDNTDPNLAGNTSIGESLAIEKPFDNSQKESVKTGVETNSKATTPLQKGSYRKGNEASIPSVNNPIDLKVTKSSVKEGESSSITVKNDSVTISTLNIQNKLLNVPNASSGSGVKENTKKTNAESVNQDTKDAPRNAPNGSVTDQEAKGTVTISNQAVGGSAFVSISIESNKHKARGDQISTEKNKVVAEQNDDKQSAVSSVLNPFFELINMSKKFAEKLMNNNNNSSFPHEGQSPEGKGLAGTTSAP